MKRINSNFSRTSEPPEETKTITNYDELRNAAPGLMISSFKGASLIKSDWPLLMSLRHFEGAGLEEEVDVPEHLAVFCTQCRS
jgi:hypothetical protein